MNWLPVVPVTVLVTILGSTDALWAQAATPACGWQGSQQWLSTRPSPLDSAQLALPGGVAKICYSRPSARGRAIYGELAPFGRAWRVGANEPTLLHLTVSAQIGGTEFPPGQYVLLAVPGPDRWMVVLHTAESTDPSRMFQTLTVVGNARAQVDSIHPPVEQFTIRIQETPNRAFLLEWGSLQARLEVRASP